ncbi:uncharacterized protein [Dipodomys merriami]|uniref:uncharacterized protein isoform X3 n=1 Tax=Dipodomys merriami TaxID=94247 RepID=UPI003855BF1E
MEACAELQALLAAPAAPGAEVAGGRPSPCALGACAQSGRGLWPFPLCEGPHRRLQILLRPRGISPLQLALPFLLLPVAAVNWERLIRSRKVIQEEHRELLMEEFAILQREVLGKELLKGSLLFTGATEAQKSRNFARMLLDFPCLQQVTERNCFKEERSVLACFRPLQSRLGCERLVVLRMLGKEARVLSGSSGLAPKSPPWPCLQSMC